MGLQLCVSADMRIGANSVGLYSRKEVPTPHAGDLCSELSSTKEVSTTQTRNTCSVVFASIAKVTLNGVVLHKMHNGALSESMMQSSRFSFLCFQELAFMICQAS